jgi:6,7-dimethyl-8-ribityllumazine synthase
MSANIPASGLHGIPPEAHIAIVAARFNGEIVAQLLAACVARLKALGLGEERIIVRYVPGAFELPLAAKLLAQARDFDAIICLGCVIRGETPHFDYVAGECARGIQDVGLSELLPVIFGVLTTEDEQQALDRVNAGARAADAAAEMIALRRNLHS